MAMVRDAPQKNAALSAPEAEYKSDDYYTRESSEAKSDGSLEEHESRDAYVYEYQRGDTVI